MRTKTIVPEGFNLDTLLGMESEFAAKQAEELDSVRSRIIRAYRKGERQLLTSWTSAGIAPQLRNDGFTVTEDGGGWLVKFERQNTKK